MRDEYEKTIANFTTQIKDIKAEAKETEKNIKEESRYDVKEAKEYSEAELSRLQIETHKLALDETEKQVRDIFKTNEIQDIIENQAVSTIKAKVNSDLVNDATKYYWNLMACQNEIGSL